jgi:photosystem II stability/assembly factor-like uncharacterized protein
VLIAPGELAGQAFSSVEMCSSDPNVAYAGSEVAVYRSQDAGLTWELVAGGPQGWGPPGVMAGWPIDMQCDPRDPNRIFANNYNGGNFLSEDGGRTWQTASTGYTGAQMRGVAVDPNDAGRVYAAGRSGIWRSDDGGASWSGLYYPPAEAPFFGLEWQAIGVDPGRSDHVLAGTIMSSAIMESEDGGTSWQTRWTLERIGSELPQRIGKQVPVDFVFAPSDSKSVYVGLCFDWCVMGHEPDESCEAPGAGVLASHDGGTSWQRAVDDHLRDVCVLDVAVDPTDAQTLYAAATTGTFKTTDGGASWAPLTELSEGMLVRTVAVSPEDPQYLLVGVEGIGVFVSDDGGRTWREGVAGLQPNGSLHDIVFDPTNPQVIYASDYRSGVYRSADGGLTWAQLNDGLRTRSVLGLSISADGKHLYVASNGEGIFRLDLGGQPPLESSPEAGEPVIQDETAQEQAAEPPPKTLAGRLCQGALASAIVIPALLFVAARRRSA